jgi:hypothetical protein
LLYTAAKRVLVRSQVGDSSELVGEMHAIEVRNLARTTSAPMVPVAIIPAVPIAIIECAVSLERVRIVGKAVSGNVGILVSVR